MSKNLIYISVLFLVSGCEWFQTQSIEKDSKLIAKVYNYELYEEDLRRDFPSGISKSDSVEIAQNLINSWAKKKILMRKAEVNVPTQNEELELLVEKYREDLYINSFKKALVAQELDTIVDIDAIEEFYNENKESFKVNEELVKFKYIAVKSNHKNRSSLRRLFLSKSKNDLFVLDEQKEDLEGLFLSDSLWIRYRDVEHMLPVLKKYNKKTVLKQNKFVSSTKDGVVYYIYINDIIKRNEIAPLRYINKTIKKMVVQQRKLQLIHKVEEVLIDDAKKNKQFEIY